MPITPVPQVPDPFGLLKQGGQGQGGGLGGILGGGGGGGMDMSPLLMLLSMLFKKGSPGGPALAGLFPGASAGGPAAPGATPIPAAPNIPQQLPLGRILGGGGF